MKLRWLITIGVLSTSVVLAVPVMERLNRVAGFAKGEPAPSSRQSRPVAQVEDPVRAPQRGGGQTSHTQGRTDSTPTPVVQSPRAEPTTRVTVYRWVDGRGVVHYESAAPPQGVRSQELVFEGRRRRDPTGSSQPPPARPAPVSDNALADNPYSVYTPEGFEELMQRVDDTVKRLGQRRETYDQLKEAL